jgi:c-di-GMP-related signal transduction protein
MVKLRHIVGANLKELERTLESVNNAIVILGVNNVGGNWFIHFVVQDTFSDNMQVKQELGLPSLTKTKKEKLK